MKTSDKVLIGILVGIVLIVVAGFVIALSWIEPQYQNREYPRSCGLQLHPGTAKRGGISGISIPGHPRGPYTRHIVEIQDGLSMVAGCTGGIH